MTEFSYTPPRHSTAPRVIIAVCGGILLACAGFMAFQVPPGTLWQILFLLSSVACVFFYVRYFSSIFTYRIQGEPSLFLVEQTSGRRVTLLCRLELSGLTKIRPWCPEDKGDDKRCDRYNFCNNLSPDRSYLLFFDCDGKRASVRLELEGEFLLFLQKAVAENERDRALAEELEEKD